MSTARRIVKENKRYDDISEVAKLFQMYKPIAEETTAAPPDTEMEKEKDWNWSQNCISALFFSEKCDFKFRYIHSSKETSNNNMPICYYFGSLVKKPNKQVFHCLKSYPRHSLQSMLAPIKYVLFYPFSMKFTFIKGSADITYYLFDWNVIMSSFLSKNHFTIQKFIWDIKIDKTTFQMDNNCTKSLFQVNFVVESVLYWCQYYYIQTF